MKKNLFKFEEFVSEELVQSSSFNRTLNIDTNDFIWNEVLIWLLEQTKSTGVKFELKVFDSGTIDFCSPGKITLRCEEIGGTYYDGFSTKKLRMFFENNVFKSKS